MEAPKDSKNNSHSPARSLTDSIPDTTPGTALTQYSSPGSRKEASRSIQKNTQQPPPFNLQGTSSVSGSVSQCFTGLHGDVQDPFITPRSASSGSSGRLKLCPTAANFTPMGKLPYEPHNLACRMRDDRLNDEILSSSVRRSEDVYSNTISIQNTHSTRHHQAQSHSPLEKLSSPNPSVSMRFSRPGLGLSRSSHRSYPVDEYISRYIKISNLSKATAIDELNISLNALHYSNPKTVVVTSLATEGIIFIQLTDIRDAQRIYAAIKTHHMSWCVEFITSREYATILETPFGVNSSDFESQVLAEAFCDGPQHAFEPYKVGAVMKNLLSSFGDISRYDDLFFSFPRVAVRADFFDTDDAKKATRIEGMKFANALVTVRRFSSDSANLSPKARSTGPVIVGQDDEVLNHATSSLCIRSKSDPSDQLDGMNVQTTEALSYVPTTPTSANKFATPITPNFSTSSRTAPSMAGSVSRLISPMCASFESTTPGTIGQERADIFPSRLRTLYLPHRSSPKCRNSPDYPSSNHNMVDTERIHKGLDVRTTIMLRNIPNKIDQAMLKEIVDETSQGQYDFMYLRIDFANNCNVGYAFINFEDPLYIIDFVEARAGLRWNRFNSDKVAEVSYATIQGKDCLVQKFRNSSVMLEHPSFRPKIFVTGTGPKAGEEDIFPGPDNPSKMRRSIENAEHVGLFAPRAGQHFRDEQRRRRSPYDRGTRLAEVENIHEAESYRQCQAYPAYLSHSVLGLK